jgi:hypothetical protein
MLSGMRGGRMKGVPAADVALAVVMVVLACLVGMQYVPLGWGPDPVPYAVSVLIFLPLGIRRRAPVLAMGVSVSALVAFLALGYDQLAFNFWGPVLSL